MKKAMIYGTVALALAAAPVMAQQPSGGTRSGSAPTTTPTQAGSAPGQASRQANPDHDFVLEAAMGGMAAVELGHLASEKAQSDQVKQFAQRMVTDHGKANDELKSLVASKNISLPAGSGAHHQAIKDRLSKLSGAAFDRAYMQEMVTDHRKDVNAFKKESTSGKDPEVKAWAAKTLPTLEEHLQMAQQASRGAVGTSGTTSAKPAMPEGKTAPAPGTSGRPGTPDTPRGTTGGADAPR